MSSHGQKISKVPSFLIVHTLITPTRKKTLGQCKKTYQKIFYEDIKKKPYNMHKNIDPCLEVYWILIVFSHLLLDSTEEIMKRVRGQETFVSHV